MAKYKIIEQQNGLEIEIEETSGVQEKLLNAFEDCQHGRCSCQTNEYEKLESLEIEKSSDQIKLTLKSKPGSKLAITEVDRCLSYTVNLVSQGGQTDRDN